MNAFDHPDELELSDWIDGLLENDEARDLKRHVAGCRRCRDDMAAATADVPFPKNGTVDIHKPAALVKAFAGEAPDPQRGQIWQLLWENVTEVVLLLSVSTESVFVAPLGPDPELGDDRVLVTPEIEMMGSIPMALWLGLARDLPPRVLNIYLGRVPDVVLEAADEVQAGGRPGFGAPITALYDERAQVRAAIERRLEFLGGATWEASETDHPIGLLADVARARGLTPSQVAEALDIAPGDARAILSGDRSMDSTERDAFAALVKLPSPEIGRYRPRVDPALVLALDRPTYRSRLRARATAEGQSEADYRYWVATRGLARAARTTGSTVASWDQLIEDFLNAK